MGKIVVNGRFLSRPTTGVERYGREILAFIGNSCRVEKTDANGMKGHLWEQFILPTRLASDSILWSPANTGPMTTHQQALTIHDLSPLEHPEFFKKSFSTWYRLFLPLLARRVRVVFTPSKYVQQKVMKRFGIENVLVTPGGVDTQYFSPIARSPSFDLPDQFVLFVGSLQSRKNLHFLLKAWDEIKDKYTNLWLVIAGDRGTVFNQIHLDVSERARFLGYVNDSDLPGLYAQATLFVLPSLDEGFGLPALEAMACGIPVIVSDRGALPEVVGEAGLIVNTSHPYNLSKAIGVCLDNPDLSTMLVAKGFEQIKKFRWQTTAEMIWNVLNEN